MSVPKKSIPIPIQGYITEKIILPLGLPAPNSQQTLITKEWSGANDNAIVYTVNPSKTLYIMGCYIFGAIGGQYHLYASSGNIVVNLLAAPNGMLITSNVPIAQANPLSKVTVAGGGLGGNGGFFWGWEQ